MIINLFDHICFCGGRIEIPNSSHSHAWPIGSLSDNAHQYKIDMSRGLFEFDKLLDMQVASSPDAEAGTCLDEDMFERIIERA